MLDNLFAEEIVAIVREGVSLKKTEAEVATRIAQLSSAKGAIVAFVLSFSVVDGFQKSQHEFGSHPVRRERETGWLFLFWRQARRHYCCGRRCCSENDQSCIIKKREIETKNKILSTF